VLYCNLDSNTASRGSVIAIRVYQLSGSSGTLSKGALSTRIIDKLANVRSGFNTQPYNRDDFGSVLYCNVESDTVSSGNCAAESIFYVSGIAKSLSSTEIIIKIYKIISMVYSGALAVGETVCIDGEKYTVKLDGANAIDKFTGDFPMILPDDNSISYEDSESARTVKVIVSRRDRHI
jgi:hypothetical protein